MFLANVATRGKFMAQLRELAVAQRMTENDGDYFEKCVSLYIFLISRENLENVDREVNEDVVA